MQKTKVNPFLIAALFAVLNLCTNTAQAQYYSSEPTFFGGFILGTNFAQINGDATKGYRRIGLNAGAVVHTRLMDQATVSMELLYSEKGSRGGKNEFPVIGFNGERITDYEIALKTAEIPICVNYFFEDKRSIVHFGFSYSQLVDAQVIVNGVSTVDQFPFKKYDLALNLGASYKIYKRFHLNFRFQNSLLNIREKHDPRVERASQTNRSISVRLLYLIKSEA